MPADVNIPQLSQAIEEKLLALLEAETGWAPVLFVFLGEPGFQAPVRLMPFATIHLLAVQEATGEEGYRPATGLKYWHYYGYLSVDVELSDITAMARLGAPATGSGVVPSYDLCRTLIETALAAVVRWGGPDTHFDDGTTAITDGKETTVELLTDTIRLGLARREGATTNRGSFEFHIFSSRRY